MAKLGALQAEHRPAAGPRRGPPVVLLHGVGLGRWFWERDQGVLADMGLESWALDLPGHGEDAGRDVSLDEVVEGVRGALAQLDRPALIGHSMGGLVAQMLTERLDLASVALISPIACGGAGARPSPTTLSLLVRRAIPLLAGRPIQLDRAGYRAGGMKFVSDQTFERVLPLLTPWPNRLLRDLARPPRVPVPEPPVLIVQGLLDPIVSLQYSRLLADYYNAILWRFDDLGHTPPLEDGGVRLMQAVGEWVLAPRRRKIEEVDALSPDEGVGSAERERRRSRRVRSNSRFGER